MNPNPQGNSGPENTGAESYAPGAAGDQDFAFAEERKPINRNLVVLLLIVLVGGGALYIMYTHTSIQTAADPTVEAAAQTIKNFNDNWPQTVARIKRTDDETANISHNLTRRPSDGQIPLDGLAANPFGDPAPKPLPGGTVTPVVSEDPVARAQQAAAKAEIQTLLYSKSGSTCIMRIGGKSTLYREGNIVTIDGVRFTLKAILEDRIILASPTGEYPVFAKGRDL